MNQSVFPYFTIYPHKFKKNFQVSQALNFLKRLVYQTYNNSTRKAIQTVFRVLLPLWRKYIISLPKSPRSTRIHARRNKVLSRLPLYLSIHLFVIYGSLHITNHTYRQRQFMSVHHRKTLMQEIIGRLGIMYQNIIESHTVLPDSHSL